MKKFIELTDGRTIICKEIEVKDLKESEKTLTLQILCQKK